MSTMAADPRCAILDRGVRLICVAGGVNDRNLPADLFGRRLRACNVSRILASLAEIDTMPTNG